MLPEPPSPPPGIGASATELRAVGCPNKIASVKPSRVAFAPLAALLLAAPLAALPPQVTTPDPLAVRFGAMPAVAQASLSPDGRSLAYVAPLAGQGGQLRTIRLDSDDSTPVVAATASGNPERLADCEWVDNQRLTCVIWGVIASRRDVTRNIDQPTSRASSPSMPMAPTCAS